MRQPKQRNKVTVGAWIVTALVAAFLGMLFVDTEYDLGIFDGSSSGASDSASPSGLAAGDRLSLPDFNAALESGAGCDELLELRNQLPNEIQQGHADRSLERIGCMSPDDTRTSTTVNSGGGNGSFEATVPADDGVSLADFNEAVSSGAGCAYLIDLRNQLPNEIQQGHADRSLERTGCTGQDAPGTTTTLNPDAGWVTGACVKESAGGTVSLVSCVLPHDGEIVSTAAFDSLCPDRTTHTVEVDDGVACLVLSWADGFNAERCSFNGIPLHGSVYLAEPGDLYDVLIAVTENAILADLEVAEVGYSFGADRCGLWHIVDSPLLADFTVAATDSEFLADFTIAIVDHEWQAGT